MFEVEDGVAILTLNRPAQGKSLNPEMLLALEAAWARVNQDAGIVAVTTAASSHIALMPRTLCISA